MGKTYKKGNDGVNPRSRAKRKFRKLEKDYVKNLPKNIDEEDTYTDLEDGLADFEKFQKPKSKR
tara:strand:+ start:176 stop:367 length:192 start_codon:yes stop_codon:yes gene_type:complete